MTATSDCCATPSPTDARKRVDYSYGLVLGVSEFRTEQGYLLGKDRSHARALHGYGTVAGLAVTMNGSEVQVAPGLALDPQGREICVPEPQCAQLNDWLLQKQADGSPPGVQPGPMTAYVVLCYRECETDRVPIPAGPCLSLDRSAVPSRIQDAFELSIVDDPPPQVEEDAIRILGDVLGHVSIGTGTGALTDAGPLVAEIRALLEQSPPVSPASPPTDFTLDPDHAGAILREALRVWVTEVRPQLVPEGGGCLGGPRDPACVLLARLDFAAKIVSGVPLVDGAVAVDDSNRPLLVQTRVLQEMLAPSAGAAAVQGGGGGGSGGPMAVVLADHIAFHASQAMPLALSAAPMVVAGRLPCMKFGPNSSVVNVAPVPRNLAPGPLAIRLQWGVTGIGPVPPVFGGPTPAAQSLWQVTLRFFGPGDAVGGSTASITVKIPPARALPALDTLVVSDPVPLPITPPPGAALVSVTVQTGGLPPNPVLVLYSAELQYVARSTP